MDPKGRGTGAQLIAHGDVDGIAKSATDDLRDDARAVRPTQSDGVPSRTPRATAVIVAALAFLPIVNWIPGGYQFPQYTTRVVQWASGSAIAIGVGAVLAILSRDAQWLWPARAAERLGNRVGRLPWRAAAAIAVIGGCLYLGVAHWLFHGRPLLIDEIIEVRQAQIFAAGHLWLPTPHHPEFFSSLLMVDAAGRTYSQFPPGGPALLALGELAHATWLVVPLSAVISVIAFGAFVRVAESSSRVGAAAIALFAVAPFTVFMSGSHMNHVTALAFILIGAAALVHLTSHPREDRGRPWLALLSGLGFGIAATIRPVDALAFALPAAVWYLSRAFRTPRRWDDALAALLGVAIPLCALFFVNANTTGAPLLFGYQVLWGHHHDLGFHQAPWGYTHTAARGLELVNLYFLRLQDYLYETPIPALLPAVGALAMTTRLRAADRYLLASCALLTALYFAYWAEGDFLGPRFMYALGPAAALWTVRFPGLLRDRLRSSALHPAAAAFGFRVTVFALATSVGVALLVGVPLRALQYRHNFATERWATPSVAAESGVTDALVFVREGWAEQLIARMWALGVSHEQAEALYRTVDVCRLDSAVTALEVGMPKGMTDHSDPYRALAPLARDSSTVAITPIGSAGTTLRVDRNYAYPSRCVRRAAENAAGASPLVPLQAVATSDRNIYARDLHARDSLLLAAYPGRPIYLVHPMSGDPGALPAFYPVARDSLIQAWREDEEAKAASRH